MFYYYFFFLLFCAIGKCHSPYYSRRFLKWNGETGWRKLGLHYPLLIFGFISKYVHSVNSNKNILFFFFCSFHLNIFFCHLILRDLFSRQFLGYVFFLFYMTIENGITDERQKKNKNRKIRKDKWGKWVMCIL